MAELVEPIYLAQTAEPMTDDERREWFQARAKDAREKGCRFYRMSRHPEKRDMCLVEGWQENPGDQGPIRWQLTPGGKL